METPDDIDDSHLPMMQRKPWTLWVNCRPPKCFLDVIPQHLLSLIPEPPTSPLDCTSQPIMSLPEPAPMSNSLPITSTARNCFGLSRQFFGTHVPSYELDDEGFLEFLSATDCTDDPPLSLLPMPLGALHPDMGLNYYPYPNENAFKLGDWFWNHGVQKSKGSFSELIKIVGHHDVHPVDVWDVHWGHINKVLGSQNEDIWIKDDSKWACTPMTISVPFQSHRGISSDANAGPKNFTIVDSTTEVLYPSSKKRCPVLLKTFTFLCTNCYGSLKNTNNLFVCKESYIFLLHFLMLIRSCKCCRGNLVAILLMLSLH